MLKITEINSGTILSSWGISVLILLIAQILHLKTNCHQCNWNIYFRKSIKSTRFSNKCVTAIFLDYIWTKSTRDVNAGKLYYEPSYPCLPFIDFAPSYRVHFEEYMEYSIRPYSESTEEQLMEEQTKNENNRLTFL